MFTAVSSLLVLLGSALTIEAGAPSDRQTIFNADDEKTMLTDRRVIRQLETPQARTFFRLGGVSGFPIVDGAPCEQNSCEILLDAPSFLVLDWDASENASIKFLYSKQHGTIARLPLGSAYHVIDTKGNSTDSIVVNTNSGKTLLLRVDTRRQEFAFETALVLPYYSYGGVYDGREYVFATENGPAYVSEQKTAYYDSELRNSRITGTPAEEARHIRTIENAYISDDSICMSGKQHLKCYDYVSRSLVPE